MSRLTPIRPIKVFSLDFGIGWWWGKHLWFFRECFAILPMTRHYNRTDFPKEWYEGVRKSVYSWKFYKWLDD